MVGELLTPGGHGLVSGNYLSPSTLGTRLLPCPGTAGAMLFWHTRGTVQPPGLGCSHPAPVGRTSVTACRGSPARNHPVTEGPPVLWFHLPVLTELINMCKLVPTGTGHMGSHLPWSGLSLLI